VHRFSGHSTTPFDVQLLQLINKGKERLRQLYQRQGILAIAGVQL
jgi:hypothetical protein